VPAIGDGTDNQRSPGGRPGLFFFRLKSCEGADGLANFEELCKRTRPSVVPLGFHNERDSLSFVLQESIAPRDVSNETSALAVILPRSFDGQVWAPLYFGSNADHFDFRLLRTASENMAAEYRTTQKARPKARAASPSPICPRT
jgi:hypothetical protein